MDQSRTGTNSTPIKCVNTGHARALPRPQRGKNRTNNSTRVDIGTQETKELERLKQGITERTQTDWWNMRSWVRATRLRNTTGNWIPGLRPHGGQRGGHSTGTQLGD